MNAVRWQCKLHPSLRARLILALTLSITIAGVGIMELPAAEWMIKPGLVVVVLWEGWKQDRRLRQRHGWLRRDSNRDWHWQGEDWQTQQPLYWLPGAVLLVARNRKGKTLRLWLMQDNMHPEAWRALRSCCFSEAVRR
ncbi:hypothetical protein IAQ00_04950 [Pantoea ananatis]|uniref:protein YgfX n=1 Tax=Pantoea ananas TaxID=553 RepID=UPI00207A4FDA|nr:protein YgfX [Pantoea ananatis]USL59129.1 hypothetical protein IAQ00_04950 [Pantoea ananatis]